MICYFILAMIHSGCGERQLNNFLAELNLPTVSQSTLKQRENELNQSFRMVAQKSMDEALKEEKEKTQRGTHSQ